MGRHDLAPAHREIDDPHHGGASCARAGGGDDRSGPREWCGVPRLRQTLISALAFRYESETLAVLAPRMTAGVTVMGLAWRWTMGATIIQEALLFDQRTGLVVDD